jgi:hypothetical protein
LPLGFTLTLENTEGAIKNGQSRETGNIVYTRWRNTKQKHNTICNGYNSTEANTNNLNKTRTLLQIICNTSTELSTIFPVSHSITVMQMIRKGQSYSESKNEGLSQICYIFFQNFIL